MSYIQAFHGTTNVKAVLRNGIRLGRDSRDAMQVGSPEPYQDFEPFRQPVIFLTDSMKEASAYTEGVEGDGVVKVRIPIEWIYGTEYGKAHGYGFERSRWYLVTHPIPPNHIVGAWIHFPYGHRLVGPGPKEYRLHKIK